MDSDALLSELRLITGNRPTQGAGALTNYTLGLFYEQALDRLASALEWRMVEMPTLISLVEDQYTYPMPDEIMRVLSVQIGNTQLVPDNLYRWLRDSVPYTTAPGSNPSRFCCQTRNLLLYPPPNSDVIDDSPYASVFYTAYSPGLGPRGVEGLVTADMRTAMYDAALSLEDAFPGDSAEEIARSDRRKLGHTRLYQTCLAASRKAWGAREKMHTSTISIAGRFARQSR